MPCRPSNCLCQYLSIRPRSIRDRAEHKHPAISHSSLLHTLSSPLGGRAFGPPLCGGFPPATPPSNNMPRRVCAFIPALMLATGCVRPRSETWLVPSMSQGRQKLGKSDEASPTQALPVSPVPSRARYCNPDNPAFPIQTETNDSWRPPTNLYPYSARSAGLSSAASSKSVLSLNWSMLPIGRRLASSSTSGSSTQPSSASA